MGDHGSKQEDSKAKRELLRILLKSIHDSVPQVLESCPRFSSEDHDDYVEGIMAAESRAHYEEHVAGCPACLSGLAQAMALDEHVSKASSELAGARILRSLRLRMRADGPSNLRMGSGGAEPPLLAAAGEEDRIGISYGVAVDIGGASGFLIECVATVSPAHEEKGTLAINADQITGVRQENGCEYEISPPVRFVENKLRELFLNNEFLVPFRLSHRHIRVELEHIGGEGVFKEAKSLTLSIIMAVLSAATGKQLGPGLCFTGRVRQDGALMPPVGDVESKVSTARQEGMKEIILPASSLEGVTIHEDVQEELRIRRYSHIGQVLEHAGLVAKQVDARGLYQAYDPPAVPFAPVGPISMRDVWRTVSRTHGARKVVDSASEAGIEESVILNVMEAVEDLSQMRLEMNPLSAVFLVGDKERINRVLEESEIRLVSPGSVTGMTGQLCRLASIVNGRDLCFAVDPEGVVESIRRIVRSPIKGLPIERLLGPQGTTLANISKQTGAVVFHLLPGGNRVRVFSRGELVSKYENGAWDLVDLYGFDHELSVFSESKEIDSQVLTRIAGIAFRMSERNLGGLFVLTEDLAHLEGRFDDCARNLGIDIQPRPIAEMSDREIINFAKDDGAVLIDGEGWFHTFRAFLKPQTTEPLIFDLGVGSRHINAIRMSLDAGCVTIVVSEDGAVTLYCNGQRKGRF